jgi:hypothetical protein
MLYRTWRRHSDARVEDDSDELEVIEGKRLRSNITRNPLLTYANPHGLESSESQARLYSLQDGLHFHMDLLIALLTQTMTAGSSAMARNSIRQRYMTQSISIARKGRKTVFEQRNSFAFEVV